MTATNPAPTDAAPNTDVPPDAAAAREAVEYCYARGWTDGLPTLPCTQEILDEFLAATVRDPEEVLLDMPQLRRRATVRLAALNAAMAGCRPEYLPVVLAAWDSLRAEGYPARGIWQSTTGTAPFILVNGPVRREIELNGAGNVFGSGARANATIGRAVRLAAINAFGLVPRVLDQATQGTPAKYSACIAENEEESPWSGLHTELGFTADTSAVTAMVVRSVVHVEARHTGVPEQLLRDLVGTAARTGTLLHETGSACLVLCPEHAHLLARHGWGRADIARFVFEGSWRSRDELHAVGKDAVSRTTRWRVPFDHPEAVDDLEGAGPTGRHVLTRPEAVLVVVAGASNSGVSAVVETFGPRGGFPPTVAVERSAGQDRRPELELPDLDTAFAHVRGMLAGDGFDLEWDLVTGAAGLPRVGARVVARDAACHDCLVSREVIAGILADALTGTGVALDGLTLPVDWGSE